jgi:metallo-beta-lactamase family protein
VAEADVLLLESTYGDRLHEKDDGGTRLAEIVNDAVVRGGKLIVPSFAIGRVEEVIYWLRLLEQSGKIPVLPVYIDSPMAAGALQFYAQRMNELDVNMKPAERDVCTFCTSRMTIVQTPQESAALTASSAPAVVIAASGMATGGRVLHHLEAALPDPKNTVLFVGYQAAGTRGRNLIEGAKRVKLHGQQIAVKARVERLDSMSAHADRSEIMRWLSNFKRPPSITHLVHGEPSALEALRVRIDAELHWPVHVAGYLERVEIPGV